MTVQVCTVNLIVRNLETSVMEITPHKIKMESGTVLTQYLITNWTLAYNNVSNVDAGIQTKIEEKNNYKFKKKNENLNCGPRNPDDRCPQAEDLECHLDSLPAHCARPHHRLRHQLLQGFLLRGVFHYTYNHFVVLLDRMNILRVVKKSYPPILFEAIVTVNLTSLLVLTTLFISVSSSLSQTAYVKMVDVWLIFAQVVPWIEVLLNTLITRQVPCLTLVSVGVGWGP